MIGIVLCPRAHLVASVLTMFFIVVFVDEKVPKDKTLLYTVLALFRECIQRRGGRLHANFSKR